MVVGVSVDTVLLGQLFADFVFVQIDQREVFPDQFFIEFGPVVHLVEQVALPFQQVEIGMLEVNPCCSGFFLFLSKQFQVQL